jgi:exodeoxyribonuclease V beta subunit
MKGFIDMVFCFSGRFYLVDWKSNFLGNQVSDYGQEALKKSMSSNFYVLQYHLYALALNQYLAARLPHYRYERHFGGVYYFFLRGIDPAFGPEYGIYRDRPEEGLITEVQERLIGKE